MRTRPRTPPVRRFRSHGSGRFTRRRFRAIGRHVIFEPDVLVFHPENVEIGDNVYVGHRTILKGYFRNSFRIGNNVWIGQNCFLHAAGGIEIGHDVGIGPGVIVLTSEHIDESRSKAILHSPLSFHPVRIEPEVDIGCGSIILPGSVIGRGAVIGAGSIVKGRIPAHTVAYRKSASVVRRRR